MDVAILGVGAAGRQYASACASAETTVSLCGEDANEVVDAVESMATGTAERIDGTTDLPAAVETADVVLETRSADPESARERLAAIEDHAPEDALLAITLETAALTPFGVGLREPDRLVGLHSATPGDIGDPIEVVVAELTSADAAEAAESFVEELGWTPLRVRDAPGFVSTRLRLAQQVEAIRLLEQGVASPSSIDATMVGADGHEVGPLELADREGLATLLEGLESLAAELGPHFDPPGLLREKVAAGETGRDRGEGFYTWDNGEPTDPTDE